MVWLAGLMLLATNGGRAVTFTVSDDGELDPALFTASQYTEAYPE